MSGQGALEHVPHVMLVTYPRCHEVHEGTYGADGGGEKVTRKE